MHESVSKQTTTDGQHQKRLVEYIPPSSEKIEQFAYQVCKQLGQKNDTDYCDTETVRGFTSFLKTVVSIKVKTMNKETNHG